MSVQGWRTWGFLPASLAPCLIVEPAPPTQLREDARRNLTTRIAAELSAGPGAGAVNAKTTLDELFEAWVADKADQGSLSPQSEAQYRRVWRGHGSEHLGALRITELTTRRADGHLKMIPPRQSSLLRTILVGMLSMAVRFDVIHHNPIREAQAAACGERKPARALTAVELERVRRAVKAYAAPSGRSGLPRGVMLPALVELLAATGARPGEVLAIRWQDVDLLDDAPSVTVNGTVMDHDRVPDKPDPSAGLSHKGGAPPITVLLPKFGVEALTALVGDTMSTAPEATVLTNRDGGLVSLSNIRSALREALAPHEDLRWITPHSFRRSVATVVRDGLGIEAAQQLGHSEMATTEQHYAQRRTTGPDARAVLDKWAGQGNK